MEENSIKPFYCRQKRVIKVAEEKTKSPRNSYCLDIYSEINLKHLQEHNNTKYRTLIHKLHMKKNPYFKWNAICKTILLSQDGKITTPSEEKLQKS